MLGTQDNSGRADVAGLRDELSSYLDTILAEQHSRLQQHFAALVARQDLVLSKVALGHEEAVAGATKDFLKQPIDRRVSQSSDVSSVRSSHDSRTSTSSVDKPVRAPGKGLYMMHSSNFSDHMNKERKITKNLLFLHNSAQWNIHNRLLTKSFEQPWMAHIRGRVTELMGSAACNNLICSIIMIYVVSMGVEVSELGAGARRWLTHVQNACNVVFIVELLLRMYAHGGQFLCGRDVTWNAWDFGLVLISVAEMTLQNTVLDSVLVLRFVRVVRIIRIIRVMRILRFFRPLRVLIRSICATTKSLLYAILLLCSIMYSFALVFTQAANQYRSQDMERHFGSLTRTSLTLFKAITNGMDWDEPYETLTQTHWVYGVCFLFYVTFAIFAVLNVITGQFCQSSIESSHRDSDDMISDHLANKGLYVEKLRRLFTSITGDGEAITLDAFETNMDDERVVAYFHSLDIKVSDAWGLFKLLDHSKDHRINLDQFVEGCLRLKGPASAISLQILTDQIQWLTERIDAKMVALDGAPSPQRTKNGEGRAEHRGSSSGGGVDGAAGGPLVKPQIPHQVPVPPLKMPRPTVPPSKAPPWQQSLPGSPVPPPPETPPPSPPRHHPAHLLP